MHAKIPSHAIHLISYHYPIISDTIIQISFIPYHAIPLSPLIRLHTSKCPFTYLPIFPYTYLFIQNMDKVGSNTDRTKLYENEISSLRSWWQWRLINAPCCGRALWKAATVLRSMFSSHLLPRLCLIVNSVATMLSCSAARSSSPNCDKADSWSWTKIPHQNFDLVWGIYTKHKRKCG